MEKKAIDDFTVVFCVASVFVVLMVLMIFFGLDVNFIEFVFILLAPVVLDAAVLILVTVMILINAIFVKLCDWIHMVKLRKDDKAE